MPVVPSVDGVRGERGETLPSLGMDATVQGQLSGPDWPA